MGIVALLFSCILLGFLTGSKLVPKDKIIKHTDKVLFTLVFLVIFILGTMIGADEKVISSLASIGLISFVLAIFAMAGSAAAVTGMRKLLKINREGIKQNE
jgi:uncharacterized membrane protein YbjE (DUF340 family)